MVTLDETDTKLISILRSNARLPVVEIAKQMGVSRATVQNHLAKLEKSGVILGYTVNLKTSEETDKISAIMNIKANGRKENIIADALKGFPAIVSLYSTNGHWDLIASIETENLDSFNKLLSKIRLVEGVTATETHLLLDCYKF